MKQGGPNADGYLEETGMTTTTTARGYGTRARMVSLALAAAFGGGLAAAAHAQDAAANLPALGEASDPWKVDVFYENDTHYRGKDATGETVGLSKFRNTAQVEADKKIGDGWAFHSVLRGTYDGVYRMNSDQFGKNAGGAITLQRWTRNQPSDKYVINSQTAGQSKA